MPLGAAGLATRTVHPVGRARTCGDAKRTPARPPPNHAPFGPSSRRLFVETASLTRLDLGDNIIRSIPFGFLARPPPGLASFVLGGNILSCPALELATTGKLQGSGGAGGATPCSCMIPQGAADLRYQLKNVSRTHVCEPTFLPGSPKCTADTRGSDSCSSGVCRTHCCADGTPSDCTLCGDKRGACYRPLELLGGWDTAVQVGKAPLRIWPPRGAPADRVGLAARARHVRTSVRAATPTNAKGNDTRDRGFGACAL